VSAENGDILPKKVLRDVEVKDDEVTKKLSLLLIKIIPYTER